MPNNIHQLVGREMERQNNKKYWDTIANIQKFRNDYNGDSNEDLPKWRRVAPGVIYIAAVAAIAVVFIVKLK